MKSKFFDFETEDYDSLSTSQLKRMADYWQRQYLLKRAKRNGYGQIYCPIKNKFFNESKMQVSHFIDRGWLNTRWDEDNVNLISEQSNVWDAQKLEEGYKSKHHKDYENWIMSELGEKKFNNLLDKSKEIYIFARQDYIDIIKHFRNE